MKLFDVYPRYEIEPVRGEGSYIWDANGTKYLDLYGGHAVISIGHSHPHYVKVIGQQLGQLGFYSNSVQMPIQEELAEKLGNLSGYPHHSLFLCNSGAEANENALKLASFHTDRKKVIIFDKGFHGRTSLAVEATDNASIQAPINHTGNFVRIPMNDSEVLKNAMDDKVAAVMIEGIQGVSGVFEPSNDFLKLLRNKCDETGAVLILDEIQSGYGRSGKFFAHQHAGIEADIISMAKGMGNGFPIGGILIHPKFTAKSGLLGTTFGGSHLACAAGIAVLDVLAKEELMSNAHEVGKFLMEAVNQLPGAVEVRGKGLMIGIDLQEDAKDVRSKLLFEHQIFTGSAANPKTLRILPPLCLKREEADLFVKTLAKIIS
jgi:acetylornithine/N-succinyldiaminopimelate aminotransferase